MMYIGASLQVPGSTADLDDNGRSGERHQRYREAEAQGGLALTMFGVSPARHQ